MLPRALEQRLQVLEDNVARLLRELDLPIEDPAQSVNLKHGNPTTAAEYEAWLRQQVDLLAPRDP